jgi:hypothetical protein
MARRMGGADGVARPGDGHSGQRKAELGRTGPGRVEAGLGRRMWWLVAKRKGIGLLGWIAVIVLILIVVAYLQHHNLVHLPTKH